MAYAEASGKNPIIVIASGFIDLVANAIFAAHLQSILPQELNSYYLFKYRKDMPVRANMFNFYSYIIAIIDNKRNIPKQNK